MEQLRLKPSKKGGKTEPILHLKGKYGPHYHPNDPRFRHWHYYFTLLLYLIEDDN